MEVREGDWVDIGDDFAEDADAVEQKAQEHSLAESKSLSTNETFKYFITISRRAGHRRLHLVGCFVKPGNCCEVRMCNQITAEEFDSICRACEARTPLRSRIDSFLIVDGQSQVRN